ncbi:MAG: NAD(P)-binding protein, partial [Rubrivivax sp.]
MNTLDTDYLVIGAGAVGLAFADTLAHESSAQIVVADRRGTPGGHWNDAYGFVTLHQPSAFYGVASLPLGSGRIDSVGPNRGCHELASGAEVTGYFDRVVQQSLLPTGRVQFRPMCEVRERDGQVFLVSLLSGEETLVNVRRRVVDASYYGTTIPATHTRRFEVADGARVVPPNALPALWQPRLGGGRAPGQIVILGAGKTAMDVALWLLQCGLPPSRITWVMPRDSWLINRATTQPELAFFEASFGS